MSVRREESIRDIFFSIIGDYPGLDRARMGFSIEGDYITIFPVIPNERVGFSIKMLTKNCAFFQYPSNVSVPNSDWATVS